MRRKSTISVVAALAMVLAACWPAPGAGPDRRAHNPFETAINTETVGDLEREWTAATGPVASEPVVSGHGVYVHDGDDLYRIDLSTGDQVWSVPAPGDGDHIFAGPVIVDGDMVTVGTRPVERQNEQTYTAWWFDAATGAALDNDTHGYVTSLRRPTAAQYQVGPDSIAFLAITDLASGESWEGGLGTTGSKDHLTLGDDLVFHAGAGLNVTEPTNNAEHYADGVRAFASGSAIECQLPVFFDPLACPVWATKLRGTHPPVLSEDGETLFVASSDGTRALDPATGDTLWRSSSGKASPAVADGRVYVNTGSGLSILATDGCDAATCYSLWYVDMYFEPPNRDYPGVGHGNPVGQPVVAGTGDQAVVLMRLDAYGSSRIAAHPAAYLTTDTCDRTVCPLWLSSWENLTTGPVVSQGRVVAGTEDGLVAYGLSTD